MSTHHSRRFGRRTAERLLRAVPGRTPVAGHDRLSGLLAAAAAPARDRELAGEQAALAAFQGARLATAPQPRRSSMLKIALAHLLTVKIAAVAAVTAGGIALAAAAGTLPGQHREETPRPASTEVVGTTSDPARTQNPKPDNSASPSPSLKGLCQAYTAGAGAEHGKAHDNPAFSALITAAGGANEVPAFCADLLGDKPGKPSEPGKPGEPGRSGESGRAGESGNSEHSPGKPTHPNR